MKYTFIKKAVTENNRAYLFAEQFICNPTSAEKPETILNGGKCINEGYCKEHGTIILDLSCTPPEQLL